MAAEAEAVEAAVVAEADVSASRSNLVYRISRGLGYVARVFLLALS